MSEKRHNIFVLILMVVIAGITQAQSVQSFVKQGNNLYAEKQYNEAINAYDSALTEQSQAIVPKFNKADSFYRLDDLAKAIDLYKEVAAESKDMKLVAKAKYNLGNSHFQQGFKQRDSNQQKAVEELETSIKYWREVLEIEPENQKAAKNIEVARLIIKDIIDQINKQKQQDPNQPKQQQRQQDPNQPQQSQQQQKDAAQDPNQSQQQQAASKEPNQPKEPNRSKKTQDQQKQQQEQEQKEQKASAPDETAEEILDREKQQREQRQIFQRGGYQKVDKDW